MKKTASLLAVLLIGLATLPCHAFSLDAAGYEGGDVATNPATMTVPGYGELVFEDPNRHELVLCSAYSGKQENLETPLVFRNGDAFKLVITPAENGHPITPSGHTQANTPNRKAIPEPGPVVSGIIGIGILLVLRRR